MVTDSMSNGSSSDNTDGEAEHKMLAGSFAAINRVRRATTAINQQHKHTFAIRAAVNDGILVRATVLLMVRPQFTLLRPLQLLFS